MVKLIPFFRQQFFDNDGKPLSGGLLYTYVAGTTTPFATYTDESGLVENTNPIVLDSSGCAPIWMGDVFLKLVLHDADDVFVDMRDNVSAGGGSGVGGALPPGGNVGDALEKLSSGAGNADWKSFNYNGISSRFGAWVSNGLKDTIDKLVAITYTAPQVSLSASGSGTIREKGTAVTAVTLSATVTKRSDPIAAVRFYKDGSLIHTVASPNPAGGTETYNWTGSFDDNTQFSVQVDDDGSTGGPTTASASQNFNFVYPYYVGASTAAETAANVALMTKRVIASTATRTETIAASNGDVFYFAYPASYGGLTSILDVNNFETFPDWTLRTENITGLDGNPVSYRIYEFDNPVVAGSYQYTFKR